MWRRVFLLIFLRADEVVIGRRNGFDTPSSNSAVPAISYRDYARLRKLRPGRNRSKFKLCFDSKRG